MKNLPKGAAGDDVAVNRGAVLNPQIWGLVFSHLKYLGKGQDGWRGFFGTKPLKPST